VVDDRTRAFVQGLSSVCGEVFAQNPELPDHRAEHPWLTGSLGDPFSPILFVAENPSLSRVRRAVGNTPESQWSVSRGDRLLRDAIVTHGLKSGSAFEPGGWRCYITDVLKSGVEVAEWNLSPRQTRERVARAWAPAFAYELTEGMPRHLIFLGERARVAAELQASEGLIPHLPPYTQVHHYTYVMDRPDTVRHLPNGDPIRMTEWTDRIGDIVHAAKSRGSF
jgi:hypothetical protein